MASQAANDFLTKEIKVSGNVVTFRLLSRQLSIHVNEAKRELELYHSAAQKSKEPVFATYVLSGLASHDTKAEDGSASGSGVPVDTPRHLIVLVPEDGLKAARNRFNGTPAQHVYSLSPVPLKDCSVLASLAERVRALDIQKGQDHAAQIGMLLSQEAPWPGTAKGELKPKRIADNPSKSIIATANLPNKNASLERTSSTAISNTTQPTKVAGRQSGLNFGIAAKKESLPISKKRVDQPLEVADTVKSEPILSKDAYRSAHAIKEPSTSPPAKDSSPFSTSSSVSEQNRHPPVLGARPKRILDSSDDDEPAPVHQRPALKRKKSRATSDDEDENKSGRELAAVQPSPAGLQAMMDIDDDGVVNGRPTRSPTPEHVLSAREVAAAARAAKAEAKAAKAEALKGVDRKDPGSRKRIPKGKKRVVRSRRVKNAKGYTVTEEYSSYEDIDDKNDSGAETEPDHEQETKKKSHPHKDAGKSSAQKAGSTKRRQSESASSTIKAKSSTTGKPGQPKLASFFGKK